MADGFLGNKFEDYMSKKASLSRRVVINNNLDRLLIRNRSYRGYNEAYKVSRKELEKIISVNSKLPSARNQQVLRFKPVTEEDAEIVLKNIKLGGALPEMPLPLDGTSPKAFIIICTNKIPDKWVWTDLGISSQSMLLKAVELGLNGICIGAFNKESIKEKFSLNLEPLMIIAIGKGAENIRLKDIHEDEDHSYYRKDGIHFVPKVLPEDLMI